jgi:hypothetical protein
VSGQDKGTGGAGGGLGLVSRYHVAAFFGVDGVEGEVGRVLGGVWSGR